MAKPRSWSPSSSPWLYQNGSSLIWDQCARFKFYFRDIQWGTSHYTSRVIPRIETPWEVIYRNENLATVLSWPTRVIMELQEACAASCSVFNYCPKVMEVSLRNACHSVYIKHRRLIYKWMSFSSLFHGQVHLICIRLFPYWSAILQLVGVVHSTCYFPHAHTAVILLQACIIIPVAFPVVTSKENNSIVVFVR